MDQGGSEERNEEVRRRFDLGNPDATELKGVDVSLQATRVNRTSGKSSNDGNEASAGDPSPESDLIPPKRTKSLTVTEDNLRLQPGISWRDRRVDSFCSLLSDPLAT